MVQLVIAIGKQHQLKHGLDLIYCNQVMLHKSEMILSVLYLISILYSKRSLHQRKSEVLTLFWLLSPTNGVGTISSTLAVAIALPPTTSVL